MNLVFVPLSGTRVVGSTFGVLATVLNNNAHIEFPHAAMGKMHYSSDGWIIARTDHEIAKYYAAQIKQRFGIDLHFSRNRAHVSIIRGEKLLRNAVNWGKNRGLELPFKYSHEIYTNGNHWWLNVYAPEFSKVRTHYGLAPKEFFHLTIGRIQG